MILRELKKCISGGENRHIEFKEAKTTLPSAFFDSVSAFLNTDGGTIILGVTDKGDVVGVAPDAINRIKSDVANLSNNPQKLDPPFLLFPHDMKVNNKTVIVVQVPLSSQIHRHNKDIFLRNEDGDYRVRGTHQLAAGRSSQEKDITGGTAQVTAQVTAFCREPRSAKEIMAELGLKHWKTFQINYLTPLLAAGVLERTIPDKPNSRLQKYRNSKH